MPVSLICVIAIAGNVTPALPKCPFMFIAEKGKEGRKKKGEQEKKNQKLKTPCPSIPVLVTKLPPPPASKFLAKLNLDRWYSAIPKDRL